MINLNMAFSTCVTLKSDLTQPVSSSVKLLIAELIGL